MDNIITAISSTGFPIVMCLILMSYISTKLDKTTTVIEQNTQIVQELKSLIKSLLNRG